MSVFNLGENKSLLVAIEQHENLASQCRALIEQNAADEKRHLSQAELLRSQLKSILEAQNSEDTLGIIYRFSGSAADLMRWQKRSTGWYFRVDPTKSWRSHLQPEWCEEKKKTGALKIDEIIHLEKLDVSEESPHGTLAEAKP